MANELQFSHLPLPFKFRGRAILERGGGTSEQTIENQQNRETHAGNLNDQAGQVVLKGAARDASRAEKGLPPLPAGVPFLLQVDPEAFDIDYLRSAFQLETVSERDDGFVLVSSEDQNILQLVQRINGFIAGVRGSGTVAKVHHIYSDDQSRLSLILSPGFLAAWESLSDTEIFTVDVSIECLGTNHLPPLEREENESDERFERRKATWLPKRDRYYQEYDELRIKREVELERFLAVYDGIVLGMFEEPNGKYLEFPDSFVARISVSGQGLKDFAVNYPYVFEILEVEPIAKELSVLESPETVPQINFQIVPPEENDPHICVIDSGIQEGHVLLCQAIYSPASKSYISTDPDVADKVGGGGHGTRVAGAILYPGGVPRAGSYKLPFWIHNSRVLDDQSHIPSSIFPPTLLRKVVRDTISHSLGVKIFNHSIAGYWPCRLQHMSPWAAAIDLLTYGNDVLFIQAAGNIYDSFNGITRLGIMQHFAAGRSYPKYLLEKSSRIANPAQSLHAITVGSVSHAVLNGPFVSSFARQPDHPSAFSATGLGIWDTIKPDVVEYGGDNAHDTGAPPTISWPATVCPELVRSTFNAPGPAFDCDTVGTSFAAPKVAHIAGVIQKTLPEQPAILYRALIAQSARWPSWTNGVPVAQLLEVIRHIGYGIPDVKRATTNSEFRVTLITDGAQEIGAKEAHVYQIPVPESLREAGLEYDYLIEITLSYVARPRRTRRRIAGYLSTWLDWSVSKAGESPQSFASRVLKSKAGGPRDGERAFPWTLGPRTDRGLVDGIRRSSGTLQKDWAIIKSHQLTEGFCVAVVGHPGWDNDIDSKAKYSLAVSIEAVNKDIEIYSGIRAAVETELEVQAEQEIEVAAT